MLTAENACDIAGHHDSVARGSFPDHYNIYKRTITYQWIGVAPPANQKGRARAPLVSVFGDRYTNKFTTHPFMDPDCATNPPPIDKSPVSTPGWPDPPEL